MQSGVSRLMESRITDLATARPWCCSSSFNRAYSVLVRCTGTPSTAAWRPVSSRASFSQRSTGERAVSRSRSRTWMRASSSGI